MLQRSIDRFKAAKCARALKRRALRRRSGLGKRAGVFGGVNGFSFGKSIVLNRAAVCRR